MLKFLSGSWITGLLIFGVAMPVWARGSEMSLDDAIHGYEAAAHQPFVGVVDDWSTHHVVYSRPEPGSETEYRVQQDPRYWLQQIKERMPAAAAASALGLQSDFRPPLKNKRGNRNPKSKLNNDWSVSLGSTSAKVGGGQYPAKFSLSPNSAPNCATDYVVFNTGVAGSTTQSTILAFNNLYPGASPGCGTVGSGVPAFYWAYNTGIGATAVTSPVLSMDGSQVAFIQSTGGVASLVLLKWAASPTPPTGVKGTTTSGSKSVTITAGTVTTADVAMQISGTGIPNHDTIAAVSGTTVTLATAATGNYTAETLTIAAESANLPGVPPTVATTAYPTCTAPCMTKIAFADGHNSTNSFPFYDYSGGDILLTGDDTGYLHKFQHVFNGSASTPPAEVGSPFPVEVTTSGLALSTPVYDPNTGLTFVGEAHVAGSTTDGKFHSVSSTGTVLHSGPAGDALCHGVGFTEGALLDPTAGASGTVYVGCDHDVGGDTCGSGNNACLRQFSETAISGGIGSSVSLGAQADAEMFAGAFDHIYLSASGPTGNLYFCGNPGGTTTGVTLYRIPIAANVMGAPVTIHTLSSTHNTAGTECSPITEFYNSSGTPTDWLFMSEPNTGNATGCTSTGCVYSFNATAAIAGGTNANFGLASASGASGIIVDNGSSSTGSSNIYYSTLGSGDAIQALQNGL